MIPFFLHSTYRNKKKEKNIVSKKRKLIFNSFSARHCNLFLRILSRKKGDKNLFSPSRRKGSGRYDSVGKFEIIFYHDDRIISILTLKSNLWQFSWIIWLLYRIIRIIRISVLSEQRGYPHYSRDTSARASNNIYIAERETKNNKR